MPAERVLIGVVVRPHGVRGLVRIRSFAADPAALGAYGPVSDRDGRRSFRIEPVSVDKDMVTARVAGVADRDAAESLRGMELFLPRTALPAPADEEYYHHDLVGLAAVSTEGADLGRVVAVENFGAGDVLELLLPSGRPAMVPFTRDFVPVVDIAAGRVVVDAAPGVLDGESVAPPAEEDKDHG